MQKSFLPDLIGADSIPNILEPTMKYIYGGVFALIAAYVFMAFFYGNTGVVVAEQLINTPIIPPAK